MEVVGVIAAVPGLIEIIQATTTAVRGLSKRKVAAKITGDLIKQLEDLDNILGNVQERCKRGGADQLRLQRLLPSLSQLQIELGSVQQVLQTSRLTKEPSKYLKRVLFLSTSLEKTLNESLTRLTQIKISLTLLIAHRQDGMTSELLNTSFSGRRLDLRALLQPSGDSFIPQKALGTCEWIWSDPTFCDWVKNSPTTPGSHLSRTFCIYGTKGCGKSVLIKSIAEELRGRGKIVLHFSFWAGSEAQRKLIDLLRTLMWQILSHVADTDLEKLSQPLIESPCIDERGLIQSIHRGLSMIDQKVYCTIDGIDESTEDWNRYTDGCFSTILEIVKSHTSLHLLLAGREPSVRTLLKDICPRLEIADHLIQDDIHRLIAAELNGSLSIHAPAIKDLIKKSLEAKTQVMFLWVTLVLKELRRCFSAEEVKQTLRQVPHDLDREYHRLFLQIMNRTSGTLTKPSISMKRARYLLFSLLACPEPMTAQDLCYAYASQVNSSGTIEDDLITVDGIIDACGDFVRVTEGRYHLIHASTSEFLTRPLKDWEYEDSNISYFRVDLTEAQESMCSACFKYVQSLELGYPLTDDGASSLPFRYPFFSYSAKFLPFHFHHTLENTGGIYHAASRFARTPQFCALVEYTLVTIENSTQSVDFDSVYYWCGSLNSVFGWEELEKAFNIELQRRLQAFGVRDERYQSWLSLANFLPTAGQGPHRPQLQSVNTLAPNGKLATVLRGNAFSSLPAHLSQAHGLIPRPSQSLHVVSQMFAGLRRATTDLMASSAGSLPVPLVLLSIVVARLQGNRSLAESLATTSVRRTRGKGDVFELCSLLSFTGLKLKLLASDDQSEYIEMLRESVRIANRLPMRPHVQWLKEQAHELLAPALMEKGNTEEANSLIRSLEKLVGKDREKSSSAVWEYMLCHTRTGAAHRVSVLHRTARNLKAIGDRKSAMDLTTQAIDILDESGLTPDWSCNKLFADHDFFLYMANEHSRCIASCQRLLGFLDKSRSELIDQALRWETQALLGMCFANQGDEREAEKWFCKEADDVVSLGPDITQLKRRIRLTRLVENLADVGQYERSQSMAYILLEDNGVSSSVDEEDAVFGRLQLLVCKLKKIGSIDSSYDGYIRCMTLLMAVDKPQDRAAKADWWEVSSRGYYDSTPSFRKRAPLCRLKHIDTCLGLQDGLSRAVDGYISLGRFYFSQGDTKAASLVSSDAASRIFADVPENSSLSFLQAAHVDVNAGLFSRGKSLLYSAYQESMRCSRNAVDDFETETFHALCCTNFLECFEEDLERANMRLPLMEEACDHLARATQAKDKIEKDGAWGPDAGLIINEEGIEESMQEQISYLQTRLERFGVKSMFEEAIARIELEMLK